MLPIFQELSQVKAIDPSIYKTREEFARDVELIFAKSSVYAEIIDLLSKQESIMNKIRQELSKPEKNFNTGT